MAESEEGSCWKQHFRLHQNVDIHYTFGV